MGDGSARLGLRGARSQSKGKHSGPIALAVLLAMWLRLGTVDADSRVQIHSLFIDADARTRTACMATVRAVQQLTAGRSTDEEFDWNIELAVFIAVGADDARLRRLAETQHAAPREKKAAATMAMYRYCEDGK